MIFLHAIYIYIYIYKFTYLLYAVSIEPSGSGIKGVRYMRTRKSWGVFNRLAFAVMLFTARSIIFIHVSIQVCINPVHKGDMAGIWVRYED